MRCGSIWATDVLHAGHPGHLAARAPGLIKERRLNNRIIASCPRRVAGKEIFEGLLFRLSALGTVEEVDVVILLFVLGLAGLVLVVGRPSLQAHGGLLGRSSRYLRTHCVRTGQCVFDGKRLLLVFALLFIECLFSKTKEISLVWPFVRMQRRCFRKEERTSNVLKR